MTDLQLGSRGKSNYPVLDSYTSLNHAQIQTSCQVNDLLNLIPVASFLLFFSQSIHYYRCTYHRNRGSVRELDDRCHHAGVPAPCICTKETSSYIIVRSSTNWFTTQVIDQARNSLGQLQVWKVLCKTTPCRTFLKPIYLISAVYWLTSEF